MRAAASTLPSNSFVFVKEQEEVDNDTHALRTSETYVQSIQPWVDKFKDVRSTRDLMEELRKPGVMNNLWDSMSGVKHIVGDLKRYERIQSTGSVQRRKSPWGQLEAEAKVMMRDARYDSVQNDEAAWKDILKDLAGGQSDERPEKSVKQTLEGLAMKMKEFDQKLDQKFLNVSENERYNDWRVIYDNEFAEKYFKSVQIDPRLQTEVVQFCAVCKKVKISNDTPKAVLLGSSELITSAEKCDVCSLVLRSFVDSLGDDGNIHLFRAHEALRAEAGGRRVLRLSAEPNTLFDDLVGQTKPHIPIGRPLLSGRDTIARFQLLRAWLHECDHSHRCNKRSQKIVFPTRVLDIGALEYGSHHPGRVRLADAAERNSDIYVALSHCWGVVEDSRKTYCTSQSNLAQRRRGFSVSELPKTFQDAITVVRSLGLRYVWIDSLCIIQSGDGGADWQREAVKMNDVFSHAYFVIAATAADDSFSGFLHAGIDQTVEHVCVKDGPGRQLYISTDVDAYDEDVGRAKLNTRAWVLQESVLARRTIHFSRNQMYWECGKGIYCENLTRLKSMSRGKSFVLDPEFPGEVVELKSASAMWKCITFLCEDYSRRHITFAKDRPIAISGLEDRIAKAIFCETKFTTFKRFLHRGLLWHGMYVNQEEAENVGSVPSWSWLSCSGVVKFRGDGFGKIQLNKSLSFDAKRREALEADLGAFFDCTISLDSDNCVLRLRDGAGSDKGWLRPNAKVAGNVDSLHCIVVGKKSDGRYLVIAVVAHSGGEEYRRFGIGEVDEGCVVKVQEKVCVV